LDLIHRILLNSGCAGVTCSLNRVVLLVSHVHSIVVVHALHCTIRYGLKLGGPNDEKEAAVKGRGIFVLGVVGGSAAASHPEIQIGMQIVSVNEVDMTQATLVEMRETLADVGDSMTLILQENLDLIRPFVAPPPFFFSFLLSLM
jgi:hypothetical protein